MEGKSGRKIETSRPISRAASSAQVSGPEHPPEIIIESLGRATTNALTVFGNSNFLDPTMPTLIKKDSIIGDLPKSSLYHHRRSFLGCFSCRLQKNIDYGAFRRWKDNPQEKKTQEIAGVISVYITNHYDFITTAPPSKHRNIENYCCFKLCESISNMTDLPFIISFQKRKEKAGHGRWASMKAENPILVDGWDYKGKSILFIDDFITSGMTAKTCYEILREPGNHVDGLIYCKF